MYIYIYIFRLIAWDLLRLSKVLFHCPVLILFGVIHEALGVTMQLPAAIFFGCLQVLGISFAHFCGMSTRWERRSHRWQARLGALNPNHFFQSLVSVGALIDHNRRNVWWRVQSWDGSMVEMPSLWDACPAAICRHHSGAIGEVRGKMRRMMRRRKHLGRVSWSIGWACFTMWSLTSFRTSPISGLSHLEMGSGYWVVGCNRCMQEIA